MTRQDYENYIIKTYNPEFNNPWFKYPSFKVFRHKNNKKLI